MSQSRTIRMISELSQQEFAATDRSRAVIFIAVGSLEWGSKDAKRIGDWEDYPVRLSRACAERLPERWSALILAAPAFSVQSRTGQGIEVKGYVLRDYLVETCKGLSALGFTRFVCVSASRAPKQLTAIEEAAKTLRSSTRLAIWNRATRPVLMSASSVLVNPASQRRSLWRYRPEPGDLSLPNEDLICEEAQSIAPKIIAALDGADPNRLFRSWYSLIPTNQSFFRAWILSLIFFVLMSAWLYVGVQGLFQ